MPLDAAAAPCDSSAFISSTRPRTAARRDERPAAGARFISVSNVASAALVTRAGNTASLASQLASLLKQEETAVAAAWIEALNVLETVVE